MRRDGNYNTDKETTEKSGIEDAAPDGRTFLHFGVPEYATSEKSAAAKTLATEEQQRRLLEGRG